MDWIDGDDSSSLRCILYHRSMDARTTIAVRTEEYKWIDGVKQDWVYNLKTDP